MGQLMENNTMSKQIDCKTISQKIRNNICEEISQCSRAPRLVVIQVGDNPASTSYVTGKEKACKEVGIDVITVKLPEDICEDDLIEIIRDGELSKIDDSTNNYISHRYFLIMRIFQPSHDYHLNE